MTLRVFRPCALLAAYVEAFWDYENLTGEASSSLSILPDTATYLCFLYQDPLLTAHGTRTYRTRSGLAGFQSFRSDLGGTGTISGVSARLTPWGLNVFRRGIVKECADKRVDCRDVFPKYAIERIEDALNRIPTAEDRVAYVEQYLLSIFNPRNADPLVRRACEHLVASGGNSRVADLACSLGLSKRTLERRFVDHIGATPKKVSRVIRLRSAILQKAARETHVVARSGSNLLGRWLDEERPLHTYYQRFVGSIGKRDNGHDPRVVAPPTRIERIWLIANSMFKRQEGRCEYGAIELHTGGNIVRVN